MRPTLGPLCAAMNGNTHDSWLEIWVDCAGCTVVGVAAAGRVRPVSGSMS